MYHAAARLPHLLTPDAYHAPAQYERERDAVFRVAWHVVGSTDDIPRSGDFMTCQALGLPVIVRNGGGDIRAFSNICAHRHCLITSQPRGHMTSLRCQYHGWEYDADGRSARIPAADNFAPLKGERPALVRYRAQTCGRLIFVAVDDAAPSLEAFLGPAWDLCRERFGDDWSPSLALSTPIDANWKVPVENALESYHVPQIHPATFKEDPGEARSRHAFGGNWTEFTTTLPFSNRARADRLLQRAEGALLRALGETPTARYRHLHVFPNLLLSFTDSVSLIQSVAPVAPQRAHLIARQYGLRRRGWAMPKRALAAVWGALQAPITRRIVMEDIALFRDVQAGLAHSTQPGMLGRCEERIHAFQQWILERAKPDAAAVQPSSRQG